MKILASDYVSKIVNITILWNEKDTVVLDFIIEILKYRLSYLQVRH